VYSVLKKTLHVGAILCYTLYVAGVGYEEERMQRSCYLHDVCCVEFRHSSSHGVDKKEADVIFGSSPGHNRRSFYVFEKHIKISEVAIQ